MIGATTTPSAPAAAKDITPWRFVGMVGNTLLSPLVPGRLGADPWTAMMDRMPDRGRCAITTLDQEAMGSPDDLLLVHSPAGRAHDRVPGPSPRGGVDASRGIARAASALLDDALGPEEPALSSSSTRSRICSSAMTKLLASSPCPRPTRCAARIRRETHWAHGGNDVSGMQLTHASPAAPEGGQQGCRQAVRRCASSGMARSRGIPFTGSFEASSSRRDSAELAVGVVALVFAVRLHFGERKRVRARRTPLTCVSSSRGRDLNCTQFSCGSPGEYWWSSALLFARVIAPALNAG